MPHQNKNWIYLLSEMMSPVLDLWLFKRLLLDPPTWYVVANRVWLWRGMVWESVFALVCRNVHVIFSSALSSFREKMSFRNLEIFETASCVSPQGNVWYSDGSNLSQYHAQNTVVESNSRIKNIVSALFLAHAGRSVQKPPVLCALVRRVQWQTEKGILLDQWNLPLLQARPSRHPGGGITPTGVVGWELAYGVSRAGRRPWGGVRARRVEWGPDGGGSTAVERDGEGQGRTDVAAELLPPQPFSASQFRLLVVVSPWHVDSGTKSSPAARKEANSVPFQLRHCLCTANLQLKSIGHDIYHFKCHCSLLSFFHKECCAYGTNIH